MKKLLLLLPAVLSAFMLISCMSCSKDNGEENENGAGQIIEPQPERNLLDLFYSLKEEQKVTGTRSRVFVVAHRANTFEGTLNNVPDNSIPAIELAVKRRRQDDRSGSDGADLRSDKEDGQDC